MISNGPFTLEREDRPAPYEAATLVALGSWDGLLSRVTTARDEAGGVQGQTVLSATLSLDADAPVTEECAVVDPQGRRWAVTTVHVSEGLGLRRKLCEVQSYRGRA
jgi:hypothetical protein